MYKICFDNEKYLKIQSERIHERIEKFGTKLYLEFGGKLFDDYHASRVLPGFEPDSKIKMLQTMKDDAEIVIAISVTDIEKNKIRGDLSITYDQDVLRLIDAFRGMGLLVSSVVLSRYKENPIVDNFQRRLESLGIKVYHHYQIDGYPTDVKKICSDEGFGINEYIQTTKKLIVVTAPGPGSGKMATCLSQIYHDNKHGIKAGYAKFETFPVWNLPLNHPVNLAYEAATVDLADMNMIDPYHLEAYKETTVNYNRDVEIFPVVSELLQEVSGNCFYKSPTDMGVNMIGFCISDDDGTKLAAKQEIIRRYYTALCNVRKGVSDMSDANKLKIIMNKAGIDLSDRKCVEVAKKKEEMTNAPAVGWELPNGEIVTGKTSNLLGATSAALLNALKKVACIDEEIDIISPEVLEPIQRMKLDYLGNHNPRLHTDEVLIALAISATTNPNAKNAFNSISLLKGSEVHSTVILSPVDDSILKKLKCNLTCEPNYQGKKLFHKN